MKKLTHSQKKEALTNALISFGFNIEYYFIYPADGRLGSKFAIAHNTESGGINTITNFMTYEEMNCYLKGYYDAKNEKI